MSDKNVDDYEDDLPGIGHNSGDDGDDSIVTMNAKQKENLRNLLERAKNVSNEIADLKDDMKSIKDEVKIFGLDVPAFNRLLKLELADEAKVKKELETRRLVSMYRSAILENLV